MPKKALKKDLRPLMGDRGIEIFLAISNGAKNFEMIKILSGTPYSCIKGRVPVLIELGLVRKKRNEYILTEKGLEFHKKLRKESFL
jgi:predicted transcriptional regulator